MLIPEAVQLVLQAASLGATSGEIFVLDMGEQIKVLDMARNLIRLSGFVPDEEIPITFIGLRPGEKLVEELIGTGETLEAATVEKVLRVRRTENLDVPQLSSDVTALIEMAVLGRSVDVLDRLRKIVPGFKPGVLSEMENRPGTLPAAYVSQLPSGAPVRARATMLPQT